ncbi:zf-HC2 domain-containing protein [Lentzea sp. NEAU-D7]|uniref:zf-HC2 domain-containing protein n=1 Tax=Lentzea sp. NEAU-D7 TaxID=2994667 RepID=UPI00224B6957|nr:zf-HC2 domain-containing protein [Lentzea sp. NEAU-D7]MCX2954506.1 zf-HC2 domain-containing protein [Lentzea sp. NEAU-D7]
MDCSICREALSARLDGEDEGVPADQVDAHLETCAACQDWNGTATALTRTLRVRPAVPVPDLTAAILDAAPPITPPAPRGWLPRMLLGGVAVAQLTLGLAQVLGASSPHGGHAGGGHLFNESTAWNLAIGLGLLWTALRPVATAGMLPVTAAFVAVLIPYSASDLINGTATAGRVLSHSLLVAGLALLALVHFRDRDPGGRSPLQDSDSPDTAGTSDPPERVSATGPRRRVRLRPVSRRGAA